MNHLFQRSGSPLLSYLNEQYNENQLQIPKILKYNKRQFWSNFEHNILSNLLLTIGYSPIKIAQKLPSRTTAQIISHIQKLKIQTCSMPPSDTKFTLSSSTVKFLQIDQPSSEQRLTISAVIFNKVRNAGYGDGIALYVIGGKKREDMRQAVFKVFESK